MRESSSVSVALISRFNTGFARHDSLQRSKEKKNQLRKRVR